LKTSKKDVGDPSFGGKETKGRKKNCGRNRTRVSVFVGSEVKKGRTGGRPIGLSGGKREQQDKVKSTIGGQGHSMRAGCRCFNQKQRHKRREAARGVGGHEYRPVFPGLARQGVRKKPGGALHRAVTPDRIATHRYKKKENKP